MSFLSILHKVGDVAIGVEHIAAPIATVLLPQFAGPISLVDSLFGRVQSSIQTVEIASPKAAGEVKAAAVSKDFELALGVSDTIIAPILAAKGQMLTYDHAALAAAISAQVAAYNAFAIVKASVSIVPLVKAVV